MTRSLNVHSVKNHLVRDGSILVLIWSMRQGLILSLELFLIEIFVISLKRGGRQIMTYIPIPSPIGSNIYLMTDIYKEIVQWGKGCLIPVGIPSAHLRVGILLLIPHHSPLPLGTA